MVAFADEDTLGTLAFTWSATCWTSKYWAWPDCTYGALNSSPRA